MKKGNTKSAGQTSKEKLDLVYLTQAFTRIGPDPKAVAQAGAILVRYFRDNKNLLEHHEARSLYQKAIVAVRGSDWYEVLWPDPQRDSISALIENFWKDGGGQAPQDGSTFA